MNSSMHRILSLAVGAVLLSTSAHLAGQTSQAAIGPRGTSPIAGATPGGAAPAPRAAVARLLPGTRSSVLTTIQGNALDSTSGALPNALVRLRDARIGRIIGSQISDKSGLFEFKGVDPGSYIVEIMGNDQTILAASQMLNVNAGEAISAVVKLPFHIPPFAGLLGNTTPSAVAVTAAAASAQVLAVRATSDTSPGSN
jgi:hypothetical protein